MSFVSFILTYLFWVRSFFDVFLNSQHFDLQRTAILRYILRIFSSASWISSDHLYSRSTFPLQQSSFCSMTMNDWSYNMIMMNDLVHCRRTRLQPTCFSSVNILLLGLFFTMNDWFYSKKQYYLIFSGDENELFPCIFFNISEATLGIVLCLLVINPVDPIAYIHTFCSEINPL